jgi:hypothetical protein
MRYNTYTVYARRTQTIQIEVHASSPDWAVEKALDSFPEDWQVTHTSEPDDVDQVIQMEDDPDRFYDEMRDAV